MNHLSYLIKTAPTVDPTGLEEASTSSCIKSWLDAYRQEWSDEDTEVNKNCFKVLKVLPSAATIRGLFNLHQDLFIIWQEDFWKQL